MGPMNACVMLTHAVLKVDPATVLGLLIMRFLLPCSLESLDRDQPALRPMNHGPDMVQWHDDSRTTRRVIGLAVFKRHCVVRLIDFTHIRPVDKALRHRPAE